jgi:cytochrome b subunit of formate dehydrogenase
MIATFLVHLAVILDRKRKSRITWRGLLFGDSSLVPNLCDLREMIQTFKWFLRLGPRPEYGKWTYWEKFDYFAVFWGVAIIGATGIILWFPEWFTHVLPGWFVNVATIVHSDEALLAVGFIFTIHFFNTHFRPEKFPMDMAMFTGRTPLEELKRERSAYYKELEDSGELQKRIVPEASKELRVTGAVFGTVALVIGFSLVLLILWSMLFGYR